MSLFETQPIIETKRFLLRQMTLDDAQAVFENLSDPDVTKDMGVSPFQSVEDAISLINFMNNLFEQNIALRWGVIRKEDQQLVGTCGFNAWDTNRGSRVEIAYDLGKAYWRKGYMSEILESLIQFSFEQVGFHRVEALTNLDATPSMNLLMKLGFKEDGILRGYAAHEGHYVDQRCFSLLKHEWK
ncbi:GNAT family N-acetyltransferase [Neobacillus sp. D3-1R]|uniref:GNAT family N-acetyltransferase n=1 Tax=Neobacillus sp. D3-1R TaxID=3445778 RepID=UPI003F9ECF02